MKLPRPGSECRESLSSVGRLLPAALLPSTSLPAGCSDSRYRHFYGSHTRRAMVQAPFSWHSARPWLHRPWPWGLEREAGARVPSRPPPRAQVSPLRDGSAGGRRSVFSYTLVSAINHTPCGARIFFHTYNQPILLSPSLKRITLTEQINFWKKWLHTYLYISSGKGVEGLTYLYGRRARHRIHCRAQNNVLPNGEWAWGGVGRGALSNIVCRRCSIAKSYIFCGFNL